MYVQIYQLYDIIQFNNWTLKYLYAIYIYEDFSS